MNGIKTILACIRAADKKYNLISRNDTIAVGISGGKDSMVLFYGLHLYSKFKHTKFKIIPIIMDLGFDNFDSTTIKEYIKSLGYELKVYDAKTVYEILKLNQKDEKHLPCSICSKMKKAIIDKAAKFYGCNKVAFAHHADDAIETLVMNSIYGGKIETFAPKMTLTRDNIEFIRPLCLAYEKDISKCLKDNKIPVLKSNCPADKTTERQNIKEMLEILYKKYPMSHQNFLNMLDNSNAFYVRNFDHVIRIENTDIYLKTIAEPQDFYDFNNFNKKCFKLKESDEIVLIKSKHKMEGFIILDASNNEKEILIKQIKINNEKIFSIVIKEFEYQIFKKFNPCIIKTKIKLDYFLQNYIKKNNFYTKNFR